MMLKQKLSLLGTACAFALGLATSAVQADQFPSDVIHMVVPWKAGGGTDSIARAFAGAMENAAGKAVVVDNISGASGVTGSAGVADAKPNGYTVLLNGSMDLNAPLTFRKLPFSLDSFAYVGACYVTPTWVLAHPDRKYKTLKDLLARAKEQPGKVLIGVAGAVGGTAIVAHAIKGITGANIQIVPYQGGADLRRAAMANEVDAVVLHSPVLLKEVQAGLIKVLAAAAPLDRISYEPARSTPTLKSMDINLQFRNTRGIFVPRSTPKAIVDALEKIAKKACDSDRFAKFGQTFGFAPVWLSGAEFEKEMRDQLEVFKQVKAKYIDK
jgi:tripartite-type tricarboxylate transporter receptor subunit TctC